MTQVISANLPFTNTSYMALPVMRRELWGEENVTNSPGIDEKYGLTIFGPGVGELPRGRGQKSREKTEKG